MHQIVGSIIKVKPEFEERYTILHKYTFPEVLSRIRKSNIRNYSIFLRDNLLFSYYEYHGNNMKEDMDAMAADIHTQNWWKLTDPMQEPLPFRAPNEWWSEMVNAFHFENEEYSADFHRVSIRASGDLDKGDLLKRIDNRDSQIKLISLFEIEESLFLYAEIGSTLDENDLISKLNLDQNSWMTSREVFHTD